MENATYLLYHLLGEPFQQPLNNSFEGWLLKKFTRSQLSVWMVLACLVCWLTWGRWKDVWRPTWKEPKSEAHSRRRGGCVCQCFSLILLVLFFFPSHRPIGFFISKVFFFQLTSDTITHHQLQVDTVFFWGVCTYQSEYATLCLSQSFNFPLNNPTGWVADTLLRWPLKWETTSCCLSAWVLGQ